jgi:hypothetical protein
MGGVLDEHVVAGGPLSACDDVALPVYGVALAVCHLGASAAHEVYGQGLGRSVIVRHYPG